VKYMYVWHFNVYICILSRRRKSVEAYTDHKPNESVLYTPKADNQVTFQATNGELCYVSSHFLYLY